MFFPNWTDRFTLELPEEEELKMLKQLDEETPEEIRRWLDEMEAAGISR